MIPSMLNLAVQRIHDRKGTAATHEEDAVDRLLRDLLHGRLDVLPLPDAPHEHFPVFLVRLLSLKITYSYPFTPPEVMPRINCF